MLKASLFALVSMLLLVLTATAEPTADPEGDIAAADGISGRDIYERVREHRLYAFEAEVKLTTGDGYGKEEESQFSIRWKDFSNGNSHGDDKGVLSKTFIQFTEPYEYLYAGYMVVNKIDGKPNDQFAYFSALRRVLRVNLRGVPLYGTDFNFSDVIPPEIDDFKYRRLEDEVYEGKPVYVVELYPRKGIESSHSKILVSIDPERYLVVRARYWNKAGIEAKELVLGEIKQFGESSFPMVAIMRSLISRGYTRLEIEHFVANPILGPADFTVRRLESH
jgi:hypothetical protein